MRELLGSGQCARLSIFCAYMCTKPQMYCHMTVVLRKAIKCYGKKVRVSGRELLGVACLRRAPRWETGTCMPLSVNRCQV
jgi:hypothetical protein